ncbi:hypothetical protein PY257_12840 [Ramlibacter sp. H39-3-26]|uniref:hypothetical protein n=1 Tax=Curvibacter soli TaxID=3031331 RepID=UPI0023DA84EB|nr:hypothetical protein [Ramlibacter sp. H39-3-26]MDF1486056.1 hypothetical protein [Ramlibacter sp. H39-3-26]
MPTLHSPSLSCALPALLLAALLAGCATLDVPRADNYPESSQKKARAVHHWDVLAEDVAARVAATLRATGAPPVALYVVPGADTDFNRGFRSLLLTRLVDQGLPVAVQPGASGLELHFDTQTVRHSRPPGLNYPMPMTTLAAGVAVARDLAVYDHSAAAGVASALGIGLILDGARIAREGPAAGGPTGTEVLVSTALQSGGVYLARTADVYYIEGADASLYRPAPPAPAPTPLKTWKVVGP